MKKLLFIISMIASSVSIGATTYDGETYDYTKGNAPSKTVYVEPKNVLSVATKTAQQQIIDWTTPIEYEITSEMIENDLYEHPIVFPTSQTITILPTTNLTSGTEIAFVKPERSRFRNFEIYLPNEPEVRAGLPCGIELVELPEGIRHVYINGISKVPTLPAKISIRQPYSKLVIGEITTFDDGWDWNPVITNCNAVWNGTSLTTLHGKKLFEGTCLQAGMSLKVAYPISGGTIVTNDVTTASDISRDGWLGGTYYDCVNGFDFTPPSGQAPAATSESLVPFTYIYETKAGKTPATWTYTFDLLAE